ncbi:L-rhamnose mutarotase [Paracoccus sp. NBH48]|uniref:L-rhamnose mutarotase n=1 Tax=Paracoccus sp. NBH48 TaxID=2596918 RepID=UPI0019D50727|nr:L-rhamnose mutarotase [Paracoccus sp. NBH48]
MKRMAHVIGIDPDRIDEYTPPACRCLARGAGPLSRSHITNYSIFLRQPENLLFSYWEYRAPISRPMMRPLPPIR